MQQSKLFKLLFSIVIGVFAMEMGAIDQRRPNLGQERYGVSKKFWNLCAQARASFRNGNVDASLKLAIETLDFAIKFLNLSNKIAVNKTPADTDPSVLVRIRGVIGIVVDLKKSLEGSTLLDSLETAGKLVNEVKTIVSALTNKRQSILGKRPPVCGPLDQLFAPAQSRLSRRPSLATIEANTEQLGTQTTQPSEDRQKSFRQSTLDIFLRVENLYGNGSSDDPISLE